MAPLTPHWPQPSHPTRLRVLHSGDPTTYTSRSISLVSLPAGAIFAPLSSPPLTPAKKAYSTVQTSPTTHVELNSDLVYINHSCRPSLEFDIEKMEIRVGPGGLKEGDELTYFYPSTEWEMAQPFECFCGEDGCKGWIDGAGRMGGEMLRGYWVNRWVRERLGVEGERNGQNGTVNGQNGHANGTSNGTKVNGSGLNGGERGLNGKAAVEDAEFVQPAGARRQGASARELAGEMGGDTM
ncbi:hypothetical protein K440DRAFT_584797 [Wilcoxina mikolae CBS 423.85]|nr:hypothetical protein K440DRAFT_584797 [Wilcoxina mikolae CBS 423.85]